MQRKQISFLGDRRFSIFRDMDNPVMTTLGEALRQYISEQDKQSALARRWLELWRERFPGKRAWSPDTVESHLSRMLRNSNSASICFFFDEPVRAALLFEVLSIPADEHARIRALASDSRQPGPRLVIDISSWPTRGEALVLLFTELRQKVLRDTSLTPVALVLTEEQYEPLPRSYDEQIAQKTLSIHKVATAAEGRIQAIELADDAALVLAPWEFDPLERWLAADFFKGSLSLEPSDALVVFAEHGALPSIPAVDHPLDAICEPAPVNFAVENFSAVQRRAWKYILADEAATLAVFEQREDVRIPAQRLALARQLGTPATSTARERLEHELEQLAARLGEALKIPVERLDPADHAERLARAELRPTPPAAWRCGDTIHLLNIDSPIADPLIEVHRAVAAVPALTRLLEHIADWTEDDHEADPSLARAVESLDPDAKERPAFLHARATLLWNDLRPAPRQARFLRRWADSLRELLSGDPPPAALRVRLPASDAKDGRYLAFVDEARLATSLKSPPSLLSWPRGQRTVIADRGRNLLVVTGAVAASELHIDTSNDKFVALMDGGYSMSVFADPNSREARRSGSLHIPGLWLPKLSAPSPDLDAWLDAVERSSSLHGWTWEHSARCEKLLRATARSHVDTIVEREIKGVPVVIEPRTWVDGDLLLAQCWLALRVALERPLAVQLSTGVVCSLGGGVSAHLTVRERNGGPRRGTVAAFDATIGTNGLAGVHAASIDFASLWTHSAVVGNYAASFGVRVPTRLVLRTPTFSATVIFLASPLLQASTPAAIGTLAATVAAQIADEEAEQAAYDDD